MKPVPKRTPPYTATQRQEATEWFVAVRANEPDADTLHAWMRWMEAETGNRAAFEAVSSTWHHTRELAAMAAPTAEELADDSYDGEVPIADWNRERIPPGNQSPLHRFSPSALKGGARAFGIALTVVTVFVGLGWLALQISIPTTTSQEFVTRTGEHKTIALSDGSQVELGARSRLLVRFTAEVRALQLEGGEAFFTVQKDPSRPFTVQAGEGLITAIGTEFDVHSIRERVVVLVAEGRIQVSAGATSAKQAVGLSQGEQVTFTRDAPESGLVVVAVPDISERLRWREGWLTYRNQPLGDVIADVGRYTDRRVEVIDPAAAALRFSGSVHRSNVDEWLAALPEAFPVAIGAASSSARPIN
jgi:transmembrane sensor